MSDQDGISPFNINTESSRLVEQVKMKTQLGDYQLIQLEIEKLKLKSSVL